LNTVDIRVAPDIISDPGRNPAVFLNPAKSGPGRIWNYKSGPGRIWKKNQIWCNPSWHIVVLHFMR